MIFARLLNKKYAYHSGNTEIKVVLHVITKNPLRRVYQTIIKPEMRVTTILHKNSHDLRHSIKKKWSRLGCHSIIKYNPKSN